jgi:Zn-dependent alcohol dehydrogenase
VPTGRKPESGGKLRHGRGPWQYRVRRGWPWPAQTRRSRRGSSTILTLWRKTIKGSLIGDCNPTTDIPRILGLYQEGDPKLDELITRQYTLEDMNEGFDDVLAGKNICGLVVHDD